MSGAAAVADLLSSGCEQRSEAPLPRRPAGRARRDNSALSALWGADGLALFVRRVSLSLRRWTRDLRVRMRGLGARARRLTAAIDPGTADVLDEVARAGRLLATPRQFGATWARRRPSRTSSATRLWPTRTACVPPAQRSRSGSPTGTWAPPRWCCSTDARSRACRSVRY